MSDLPEGYNLRGLMYTYLKEHGWEWSDTDESWTHHELGLVFSGPEASDWAIHTQIEHEEGRAVAA